MRNSNFQTTAFFINANQQITRDQVNALLPQPPTTFTKTFTEEHFNANNPFIRPLNENGMLKKNKNMVTTIEYFPTLTDNNLKNISFKIQLIERLNGTNKVMAEQFYNSPKSLKPFTIFFKWSGELNSNANYKFKYVSFDAMPLVLLNDRTIISGVNNVVITNFQITQSEINQM